jgi:cobalamin biosynthesis protein CobW
MNQPIDSPDAKTTRVDVLPDADRIPALVVSGFLGSGKTTLIRYLLDEAVRTGVRVALISNELGELGIDRALLGQGEAAYVELEGGCVCCELSDDLLETLQQLFENVRPDRVVIETSGVALPYDTQLNFWREPVCNWIGDDMAVVVVNAEQVVEGRDLEGTFTDQISSADLLIMNKVDLVSEAELASATESLRALEPDAPLITCSRGQVAPEVLFPPTPEDHTPTRRSEDAQPASRPHTHEHFRTDEWRPEAGISADALEAFLRDSDVLRAKGFVHTDEGVRLVQVVGRRVEISQPDDAPPAALVGRVVMIHRADT